MVIRSTRSATASPATMQQVRIAPALTIGFGGRPVSSSSRIASNASPVGLTADCIENGLVASPALYT